MGVSMRKSSYSETNGGGFGNGGGGGGRNSNGGYPPEWNEQLEVVRWPNGYRMTEVTSGSSGWTFKRYNEGDRQIGRKTYHAIGDKIHLHGMFADNGKDSWEK